MTTAPAPGSSGRAVLPGTVGPTDRARDARRDFAHDHPGRCRDRTCRRGRDDHRGGGNWTHNDGVQISSGAHVTIRRSRFERNLGNAAIFIDPDFGVINNVLVEDNVLGVTPIPW